MVYCPSSSHRHSSSFRLHYSSYLLLSSSRQTSSFFRSSSHHSSSSLHSASCFRDSSSQSSISQLNSDEMVIFPECNSIIVFEVVVDPTAELSVVGGPTPITKCRKAAHKQNNCNMIYSFRERERDYTIMSDLYSIGHQLSVIGPRNQLSMEQKQCIFKQTHLFVPNLS